MKRSHLWLAASVLCMLIIFVSSAMNGGDSHNLSGAIATTDFSELLVRKAAHLVIYLLLGVCLKKTAELYISIRKKNTLLSIMIGSVYAASDELHQYFVPGRQCAWQDWLLDTVGVLLGVGIVMLFSRRKASDKD